jgi:hypothetical protein
MSVDNGSNNPPYFHNYENIILTSVEREVLALLFAGYEKLVLKAEFGGGFGGGRVLLLRPIAANGAELPTVVKLGPAAIIQQEWRAFADFVRHKVPKVARIEDEPVFTVDGSWGGVRYPLAGNGRFQTESLGSFCQSALADDVKYVLEQQLFPSLGVLWQDSRVVHEFFLARTLDAILPVNLIVTHTTTALAANPLKPGQSLPVGAEIIISDLVVTEVDNANGELTLDLPTGEDGWSGGFRMRVTAVPDVSSYQVGQPLPQPITGKVDATRHIWLQSQLDRIFYGAAKTSDDTVSLPNIGTLPNPLDRLPDILRQTRDIRVGVVHGDLNLENVLVEYDDRSRNIYLIDFARARQDWVLHDLLRLETSFWLYLVSAEMVQNERPLADLQYLLDALHTNDPNPVPALEKPFRILTAVRKMAQHLLMNPQSWDEYYQGLIVYLLGALKFKNLDSLPSAPFPKQVAFAVAAFLQKLRQHPPISKPVASQVIDEPKQLLQKPDLMREIRVVLQECEPFESQRQLRAYFTHPELKPWRNRLPEEHRLTARVDGTVALLHNRHSKDGKNALAILLDILSRDPNTDEEFQPQLASLTEQFEAMLQNKP